MCRVKDDMLLDIVPVIADLLTIQAKRQTLIDENHRRANLKRRSYDDYAVGDWVMIKEVDPKKMEEKTIVGPSSLLLASMSMAT